MIRLLPLLLALTSPSSAAIRIGSDHPLAYAPLALSRVCKVNGKAYLGTKGEGRPLALEPVGTWAELEMPARQALEGVVAEAKAKIALKRSEPADCCWGPVLDLPMRDSREGYLAVRHYQDEVNESLIFTQVEWHLFYYRNGRDSVETKPSLSLSSLISLAVVDLDGNSRTSLVAETHGYAGMNDYEISAECFGGPGLGPFDRRFNYLVEASNYWPADHWTEHLVGTLLSLGRGRVRLTEAIWHIPEHQKPKWDWSYEARRELPRDVLKVNFGSTVLPSRGQRPKPVKRQSKEVILKELAPGTGLRVFPVGQD